MTTWVLLRGLTREKRHWGSFPRQLLARFPEDRVLALELPGNGELNGLASPVSIGGMAAFCREQLARSGAAPPCILVGMSMGAMVASEWANRHPGEIAACVMVISGPPGCKRMSSSSSAVVFGRTMSASSAVGVMVSLATRRKSSDRSASTVFGVLG